MSSFSSQSLTLAKSVSLYPKHLSADFQSLAIEDKYRITRVTSTQLTEIILQRLSDLDLVSEIPNKPLNSKKGKQKGEPKLSEDSAFECFFDGLMVYSEIDFLDSIGLDFSLIKDANRMGEILALLCSKNTNFSPLKIPPAESLTTKQAICVLVAVKISHQLKDSKESDKQAIDPQCCRKEIGNLWSHLQPQEKVRFLHLQTPNIQELIKALCKKGIVLSGQVLEKEIRQLVKLEKNEFCNKLLRCRLKRAVFDPLKKYHKELYGLLVERLRLQRKKKIFKKEQGKVESLAKNSFKEEEFINEKTEKPKSLKKEGSEKKEVKYYQGVDLSPPGSSKENHNQQHDERVKDYSVASNQTNETEYKQDLKYFGEDSLSKKIEVLYKHKVSSDLVDFGDIIAEKANSYQKYRLVAFNRIQCCLSNFQVQLILFGSCANGLMLQKSDLDVAIAYNILNYFPYGTVKERVSFALSHLFQMLNGQPWISKCNLITTASIPVLKLEIDTSVSVECPLQMSDDDSTFVGYPKDKVKIEMDVTVDTSPFSGEQPHLGIQATQMTKEWMEQIPNLYNIAILLKYLLQKTELNSTYKGGIGSYCTIVMVIAYLRHFKKQNDDLISQLEGFINFYGREFDECSKGVDITKEVPFYMKENPEAKLEVRDPINNRIMTKNAYLYPKIKEQLLRLKKRCIESVRNQVIEHIGELDKEERESIECSKEYFVRFEELYSKNIFCQFDFS